MGSCPDTDIDLDLIYRGKRRVDFRFRSSLNQKKKSLGGEGMVRDGAVQSLAGNLSDGQALKACKDFIPRM